MKDRAWLVFAATATAQALLLITTGWTTWLTVLPTDRATLETLWITYAGLPMLACIFLILLPGIGIYWLFTWYIKPLRAAAEETQIITTSNPRHRIAITGGPELAALLSCINELAAHYNRLQETVGQQINTANQALEEEKNTLAALLAKLPQGVLVCNQTGHILLYNRPAQLLLAPSESNGDGAWVGLGRSIYGLIEAPLLRHAVAHIEQRLQQRDSTVVSPFVISRFNRLLSAQLIPVLRGADPADLTGFILTLEDITEQTETTHRLSTVLRQLGDHQRSSIASLRAAIEMLLDYPDMAAADRLRFMTVIRDEAVKLSTHLDTTLADYANDLHAHWPLKAMNTYDLLTAFKQRLSALSPPAVEIITDTPAQALWLHVDSYTLSQALALVTERLRLHQGAQAITLRLEPHHSFVALILTWQGQPLLMATLNAWGKEVLLADQGRTLTLQDVIDHHGGAVWTEPDPRDQGHALRMLLPLPARPHSAIPESALRLDQVYDFRLFQPTGGVDQEHLLTDLHYTVIDTETTGLNPSAGDEIIAIGAVRIIGGRLLEQETFDCLIDPRRPLSEAAIAIHGIQPAMLRGQPTLKEVLPRFKRFIEDSVIVGHNVAFDMRFLTLKEAQTGVSFNHPVLDTLLLAWAIHPYQEEHSLESLAHRLGVSLNQRHHALGDALTTARIFIALLPLLAERGIRTLSQAQAACQATRYARLQY